MHVSLFRSTERMPDTCTHAADGHGSDGTFDADGESALLRTPGIVASWTGNGLRRADRCSWSGSCLRGMCYLATVIIGANEKHLRNRFCPTGPFGTCP